MEKLEGFFSVTDLFANQPLGRVVCPPLLTTYFGRDSRQRTIYDQRVSETVGRTRAWAQNVLNQRLCNIVSLARVDCVDINVVAIDKYRRMPLPYCAANVIDVAVELTGDELKAKDTIGGKYVDPEADIEHLLENAIIRQIVPTFVNKPHATLSQRIEVSKRKGKLLDDWEIGNCDYDRDEVISLFDMEFLSGATRCANAHGYRCLPVMVKLVDCEVYLPISSPPKSKCILVTCTITANSEETWWFLKKCSSIGPEKYGIAGSLKSALENVYDLCSKYHHEVSAYKPNEEEQQEPQEAENDNGNDKTETTPKEDE